MKKGASCVKREKKLLSISVLELCRFPVVKELDVGEQWCSLVFCDVIFVFFTIINIWQLDVFHCFSLDM